jgi:hypothetical protein
MLGKNQRRLRKLITAMGGDMKLSELKEMAETLMAEEDELQFPACYKRLLQKIIDCEPDTPPFRAKHYNRATIVGADYMEGWKNESVG